MSDSQYKTGQFIYANTKIDDKYVKIKMVVTEITEISEEEYKDTAQYKSEVQ